MSSKKKILLLSELEHVLKRPEMYVSSTIESDEKIPLLEEGVLHSKMVSVNVGMYKLLWEIFDNSLDEIKRSKKKSKSKRKKIHTISITLNKEDNSITVKDDGDGFYQAIKKNPKSGVTNIETAYCFLRSGSNFENEEIQESLIGTNGVGASLVNMLSDRFEVRSTNSTSRFAQFWDKYKQVKKKPHIKKGRFRKTGTEVKFIPRKEVFGSSKYDEKIIQAQLAIRKKGVMLSPELQNVNIKLFVENDLSREEISLPKDFFHDEAYVCEMDNFSMAITPKYDDSDDILVVNSTECVGSPTRYIQSILDEDIFKNKKAHNYFNVQMFINLPPKLVKFGDQNKTKYSIPKNKISPHLNKILDDKKIKFEYRFPKSATYDIILEDTRKTEDNKEKKAILRQKNKVKKISKKYTPASRKKEFLFIVEGESAAGSILQGRDPDIHGIYSLKGKIQNCRRAKDLSSNKEIVELISILDLKFGTKKSSYKNIIIATDFDPDGIGHIASLLINFFYRWFPDIVKAGKLFIMKIPLMSYGSGKNIQYLYSLNDIEKHSRNKKIKQNKRYLKGLGSLSVSDWDNLMKNMNLIRVKPTNRSMKYLDMAFGKESILRKKWLNEVSSNTQ